MPELVRQEETDEELRLYSPGSEGLGRILINPDVIARIAGKATDEVEGVALMSKFSFADILSSKEPVKGIQVLENESGRYSILCAVKMAYGTSMTETAEKLQRHIKDAVERMAGLELERVDIKIVDIFVEKEKDEED